MKIEEAVDAQDFFIETHCDSHIYHIQATRQKPLSNTVSFQLIFEQFK